MNDEKNNSVDPQQPLGNNLEDSNKSNSDFELNDNADNLISSSAEAENTGCVISEEANVDENITDVVSEEINVDENIAENISCEETSEELPQKNIATKIKEFILGISYPNCIMRFAAAYLLVSSFFTVYHYSFVDEHSYKAIRDWQQYCENMSIPLIFGIALAAYIILTTLKCFFKKTRLDSYMLIIGLVAFSLANLWRSDNVYYVFISILVTAVFGYIGWKYDKSHSTIKLPLAVTVILIVLLTLISGAFIAIFTLYRYESYGNSCFDLGIFTQMYHSMINDFSMVTTCERDKFLSHFAVHCSPIYYLLLPFYYFFPTPHTLLIAQASLIAIGVIPLAGICRRNKFTNLTTLFFCVTYLFCAELIGPCFYEFHENAFLPPLLMWLFYGIESNKKILVYIFTILTLMVKEDAPIYIVCIGLYLLFRKDKPGMRKHGAIIAIFAVIYFVVVTSIMTKYGEGVMTSRTYGNLMIDWEAGFGEVIKNVITNPSYFLSQLIREDNLVFFLTVMVPLGMMPLFTKKFSRLALFIPFLLMNLASGYVYARDIGFQYVFGTSTCLIYATVINCADLRPKKRQYISAFTAMASVYMSVGLHSGKIYYQEIYSAYEDKYEKQDELLASIPSDASVVCDTFYIPPLANRKEIYMMDEWDANNPSFTDFVIIRLDIDYDYKQQEIDKILAEGYEYYNGDDEIMAIYVSPEYRVKLERFN